MPLLLLTGCPASGKSTICQRIVEFLKEKNVEKIVVVSDDSVDSEFSRRPEQFLDKRKQTDHNCGLRSEVIRILSNDREQFVIVDSMNFARSQRYELYAVSRNNKTTFGILFCDASEETVAKLNQMREDKYEEGTLIDMRNRYEPVVPRLNGEKPLFSVQIDAEENSPQKVELPTAEIFETLMGTGGKTIRPNASVAPASKASTSFVQEVDELTQKAVRHILDQQHKVGVGRKVNFPWADDDSLQFTVKQIHSFPSLNRLRSRFLDMTRQGLVTAESSIVRRFVEYLESAAI